MLEALFALCRKAVENEPLKIFMALSDLDRNRQKPLEPATVDRLARDYRTSARNTPSSMRRPPSRDKSIMAISGHRRRDQPVSKIPLFAIGHRRHDAGADRSVADLLRQGTLPAAQADATFLALLNRFRTDPL